MVYREEEGRAVVYREEGVVPCTVPSLPHSTLHSTPPARLPVRTGLSTETLTGELSRTDDTFNGVMDLFSGYIPGFEETLLAD